MNEIGNTTISEVDNIGNKIRKLRSIMKFSIRELSELSGVSKTNICDIENNNVNPTIDTLLKIAAALNVNITTLIQEQKNESIGEKLKKIRIQKNMTQEELAVKCDIARVSLGNYERGTRIPNINTVNKLAAALNINLNILMEAQQEGKDYIKDIILVAGGDPNSFTAEEIKELKKSIINFTKFKLFEMEKLK